MTVVRPEALPGEVGPGYLGRLIRLNGWTNPQAATPNLLAWAGSSGASFREVPLVELLAKVAGMDTTQFVREHTMLPLRRAVVPYLPEVDHGCLGRKSLLWQSALSDARPGAYFCLSCIHEDHDFHGTPYWRREHQMPGMYCCVKHMLPLCYVEAPNAFLASPSAFFQNHHAVDERWAATLQECQPVLRFLAVSSDLIARSKPLDERDVSRVARARAFELGLHVGRGAHHKELVSDFVCARFDKHWLASVVPGLAEKTRGKYWHPLDGTLSGNRNGIPTTAYIIVFSALFDSSDEAINAMLRSIPESRPRSTATEATATQIRTAYVANRGCHSAVASALGIGHRAATRQLLEQGLPNLSTTDGLALRSAAESVFLDGVPLDEAGKMHGVRREDIEGLLLRSASPFASALSEIRRADFPRTSTPRAKPIAAPCQRQPVALAEAPLGAIYSETTVPQNVAQ